MARLTVRHNHSGGLAAARLATLLALAFTGAARAQFDTSWARFYNGPGSSTDDANALAVDGAGNVYAAGQSFGAGTNYDYCTIKYGPDGTQRWAARFNGPANSNDYANAVAVDSAGSVYVTGTSMNSAGNNDIVTIKYDSTGAQQWIQAYNGPSNSHEYGLQIAVDLIGDIVIAGYGANPGYDYLVLKYAPDGTPQWNVYYNGTGNSTDYCYSLAIDLANSIIVTGGSVSPVGSYDYATVKYDQTGGLLWARRYNGTGSFVDNAYSVTTDAWANVCVTGSSHGAAGADADFLTIKYDVSGTQLWTARYNGDGNDADDARCVRVGADGYVYVCGNSMGLGTNQDMATICYAPDSTRQWVVRYNGTANSNDYAYYLGLDSASNVYVTGPTQQTGVGNEMTTHKYDRYGTLRWTAFFGRPGGSDWSRQLKVDQYANVYVGGFSTGSTAADMTVIKYMQPDAAAGPVLAPLGRLDTNAVVAPRATVSNNGTATQTFRAYCLIRTAGGVPVFGDSAVITGLARGASVDVAFDTWPMPHPLYQYLVQCSVAIAFDTRPDNDTALGSFTIAAGAPGWREVRSVPSMPSGREVKDGGTMTFHAGAGLIYLLKGNKSGDFYSFHPFGNAYVQLLPLPNMPSNKPVYKGAALTTDGSQYVYAVKGNNTQEFWRYDVSAGNWQQLDSVPLGMSGKGVKGGGELLYVNGSVYLLKGYRNEFYRYDPNLNEWSTMPSAPSSSVPKWDRGSFAVWDGAGSIYAGKAKYNELWRYDLGAGAWDASPRAPMPFYGVTGKVKKLKDGGCGTWYDGAIFALKGGNTQEFWEYRAAENKWYELDTIPILGSTGKKKRVKAGGDIVSTGYALYALKGNKTLEMWRYILPQPGAPGTLPSGQMAAGSERSAAGIFPNPCVDAVRLSLPVFGRASVALFDVTGRNVLTRTLDAGPGSPATIDLRGLCAGVYLVRAEVAGNSFTRRLVIQR